MPDLFALSIPVKVSGKQEATAQLQAIGKVGQQVAKDLNLSFAQTKGGLLVPANEMTKATTNVANATRTAAVSLQRYATGAQQMAGAMLLVSTQGKFTAESIKQVITQASAMAFMFGPTGAIVGAIGIATASIATLFGKARTETEKLKTEALAAMRQIRYETNLGPAYMRASELANQRTPLDERLTEARAKLSELLRRQAELTEPPGVDLIARTALAAKTVRELETEMADLDEKIKAANESVSSLAESEGRLQRASELVAKRTKDAAEAAKSGIPIWQRVTEEIREQVRAEALLADMARRRARSPFDIEAPTPTGTGAARAAARGQAAVEAARKAMGEAFKAAEELRVQVTHAIANGISNGISAGFAEAFRTGNIAKGLEALGRTMLAALGQILQSIGERMLAANLLAQKALAFLGGPLGIAASLGLIALGGALAGLASAGGGGGYGGPTYGRGQRQLQDTSATYTIGANANHQFGSVQPVQPMVNQFTIIGGGPEVERKIYEIVERASRRGMGPPQTWRGRS